MSSLNEIGRCHTDYGYVVIGTYGSLNYDEKVAYFYRNYDETYTLTPYDIGEIMEEALNFYGYDYCKGYSPEDLENWNTLYTLMVMQSQLFQQKYEVEDLYEDD